MKKTGIFFIFLITSIFGFPQDFWQQGQMQKNTTAACDTGCQIYNVGDPEVTIEWQYVLGDTTSNNLALDIVFSNDSNLVYLYKSFLDYTVYLVCMQQNGIELWRTKIFTPDSIEFGNKITKLDSYYYVTGSWEIDNVSHFGAVKINSDGEKLWFKELFNVENTDKKIRLYNPYLLNAEGSNFLGSFVKSNGLSVAKLDSSCNVIWEKYLSEFGVTENIYIFNIAYDFEKYYVFASTHDTTYYYILNTTGYSVLNGKLPDKHFNTQFRNDKFYFTGYNENTDDFVRRYSNELKLETEFIKDNDSNSQYDIWDAADIKVINDESILVFYNYEYMVGGDYDVNSNFNILHLSRNCECLSTLNLYAPGSQYTIKLLTDAAENCLVFGYGYNAYYDKELIALGKILRWDPVKVPENSLPLTNSINIFPNPSKSGINIEFGRPFSGEIEIYSISGLRLIKQTVNSKTTGRFDVNRFNSGIYIITFTSKNEFLMKKFMKY